MFSLLQLIQTQTSEHSYLANLSDSEYLSYERLAFYQEEKFFAFKCPVPSVLDALYPGCIDYDRAYAQQQLEYFSNPRFLDRQTTLNHLEKLFNFVFPGFSNKAQGNQKAEQGTTQNPIPQIDLKHVGALNMQLKSQSIISLLFLTAFFVVLFRMTKKSELLKQKIPKTLSIFWLYNSIQLYLDLNIFQLETKPLSKILFLDVVAFDQTFFYIPEILHLLMVIGSFLYFISLVLRFNEIFGQDEMDQISDQLIRDQNNQGGQGQINGQRQELGGIVSQSLISVDKLSIRSSLEFYHYIVLHVLLFLTFAKSLLLTQGYLFICLTPFPINLLDCLELFPTSARYLSLFTISFLSFSHYIGRTPIDKLQYLLLKTLPFILSLLHSLLLVLKRGRFLFTLDDFFVSIIFVTSLCLYLTYESPMAEQQHRYPWPFLEQAKRQSQQPPPRINNDSEPKLTKEQIERRQQLIDQALKKRQEEHEDYMRKKEEVQRRARQPSTDSEEVEETYGLGLSNEAAAKVAQMRLQELILQQINQLNDESKKILTQGLDLNQESEIIQKLGMLASLKSQEQVTQGGQGQQKQTAHKAPTKAPTGRPNQRKRR